MQIMYTTLFSNIDNHNMTTTEESTTTRINLDELSREVKECILPIIGDIGALTFISSVQEHHVLAVIQRYLSNSNTSIEDSATQLLAVVYSNHLIHLQQSTQTVAELLGEAKKIFEIQEYLTKCHELAKAMAVHSIAPSLIHNLEAIKLAAKLVKIPPNSTNYWSSMEYMQTQLFEIGWKDPVIRSHVPIELVVQFASLANSVIDGDDLAAAENASAFFKSLLQHTLLSGSSAIAMELVSQAMRFCHNNSALNRKDSSVRSMRFLSVMIDFAAQNEEQFRICSECGVVDELFRLCRGNPPPSVDARSFEKDILVQITAIELLPSVASCLGGLGYLCSQGMVDWLVRASSAEADPFISGEALRNLCVVFEKSHLKGFPLFDRVDLGCVQVFLRMVRHHLEEGDETQRITGLAVLSHFACISAASLELLFQEEGVRGSLTSVLLFLLRTTSRPDLTAAVLKTVAAVLDCDEQQATEAGSIFPPTVFASFSVAEEKSAVVAVRSRMVQLKKQLFFAVGPARSSSSTTLQYLLALAQQPVASTRHAAVDLMRAAAAAGQRDGNAWGLTALFQASALGAMKVDSPFFHYLRNRGSEFDKAGKDWKFSLITAVHSTLQCAGQQQQLLLLNTADEQQVRAIVWQMVQQGPYYMPPRVEDPQTMEG